MPRPGGTASGTAARGCPCAAHLSSRRESPGLLARAAPAQGGRTTAASSAPGRRHAGGGGREGGRGAARTAPPRLALSLSPPQGAGSAEEGARRQPRGQKPRAGRGQSSGAGLSSAGRHASSRMAGRGCPQRLALLLLLALLWPGRAAAEVSARDGAARGLPRGRAVPLCIVAAAVARKKALHHFLATAR